MNIYSYLQELSQVHEANMAQRGTDVPHACMILPQKADCLYVNDCFPIQYPLPTANNRTKSGRGMRAIRLTAVF